MYAVRRKSYGLDQQTWREGDIEASIWVFIRNYCYHKEKDVLFDVVISYQMCTSYPVDSNLQNTYFDKDELKDTSNHGDVFIGHFLSIIWILPPHKEDHVLSNKVMCKR